MLTTAALVQTSLTDTIGRYFTHYKLETVIRFKETSHIRRMASMNF